MSLEIREMIVRTTLTDTPGKEGEKPVTNGQNETETDIEYIIAQCISRIMEMIQEENEK